MPQNPKNFSFIDLKPALSNFREEVVRGFSASLKSIPPKYFYDKRGSELYDQITKTKEYYPTRSEKSILKIFAKEISAACGAGLTVVELGCGSSEKIRLLLNSLESVKSYLPIDISKAYLVETARELARDYPAIEVKAICADFTQPLDLRDCLPSRESKRLIFFPGSTVGNFSPSARDALLDNVRALSGKEGLFLVGVDLKKDPQVLDAAYNDKDGVTAAFNKNLLERLNNELDGAVDPEGFDHAAGYVEEKGRVEMHLISRKGQTVKIGTEAFHFSAGEKIHTESSYKYTAEEFSEILKNKRFSPVHIWTDPEGLFSLHLARGF